MAKDYQDVADYFFELASKQRLDILQRLAKSPSKITKIAKEIGATVPEVHRNFERLVESSLVEKNGNGEFHVSVFGSMVLEQIPSFTFMTKNEKYFKNHIFWNIPAKFIQRVGALNDSEYIKGFVKIQECWKSIYSNAQKQIQNILYEAPYSLEIMKLLDNKIKSGVRLQTIFSENIIVPKERRQIIEKSGFKKNIQDGLFERKMRKDVSCVVVLNENEACLSFPKSSEPDVGEAFYGKNPDFIEWCKDYFLHCWDSSDPFRESKLD